MGTTRDCRVPVVFARLTRIVKIQVLIEERPPNRSTPRSAAIHVSCTTSSAVARSWT